MKNKNTVEILAANNNFCELLQAVLGAHQTVPELPLEKKHLIPDLWQLLISFKDFRLLRGENNELLESCYCGLCINSIMAPPAPPASR
jgi:hypothetical protein